MTFQAGDRVIRRAGYSLAGLSATVLETVWNGRQDTIVVDFDNQVKRWSGYADRFELLEARDDFEVDE